MGELRPPVAEVARHPDGTVVGGLLDAMAAHLYERHGPNPMAYPQTRICECGREFAKIGGGYPIHRRYCPEARRGSA